jgi:hypothetical protein
MPSLRTLTARRFFRKTLTRKPPARRPSPLSTGLETLEAREVPSASLIAVGADAGGGPRVAVIDRNAGTITHDFFAYDPSFTGGVRVAVGDFNADGTPDVITAPGPGGGPHIKVFDGKSGDLIREFMAFDPGFLGGVNLAVGDVTGDGAPDLVVGADAGGGPRVTVFDGKSGGVIQDFFAFDPSFAGGVRVAVGDVTGDGKGEILAAAGPGGGPAVHVFDAATAAPLSAFFAFDPSFAGGVYVAAADLTRDGKAEVIAGAGAGGGPAVHVLDAVAGSTLSAFFAYDPSFTGGVRVASFAATPFARPDILTSPGAGGATDTRIFSTLNGVPSIIYSAFNAGFTGGAFVAGSNFAATAGDHLNGNNGGDGSNGTTPTDPVDGQVLVTLHLNPLDINLLGLQVQTSPITVTVSVEAGDGKLLGNLLTVVSNLVNMQGVNNALNNVLDSVVNLVNSAALTIDTALTGGPLSTSPVVTTTPILDLYVAPVHLNLLGAVVDTSPITVAIRAHSGDGLVLGNVLTELAHLFDPPLPDRLDLAFINARLAALLTQLEEALPGIPSAPVEPVEITSNSQVLRLVVPPIDLNLLGLNLKTDTIRVDADALTGEGRLLGNVLTTLLNTLDATPEQRQDLSNNLNALLAKVIGVLNSTNLVLPAGAVEGLSQVLQTLALPDLVTSEPGATVPVLNLVIASPDGDTPPVDVDLLGLKITTSNIRAQLIATTGEGQVLGNLLYNVAHLLDPGGRLSLLNILLQLGL